MPSSLIALGGAEGVWEELEEALKLCPGAYVGAVNDAGKDFPGRLTVWATLHPEKFRDWQRQRSRNGFNADYLTVAPKGHFDIELDHVIPERWGGTSGLYLCQVALLPLGYERVIACGMPLDSGPHYFAQDDWEAAARYRRGWVDASRELGGRLKSMSGWTREVMGHPTDWLAVSA